MSNPTIPGHPFVRPGQVARHLPPPDNCVTCGQPEYMHATVEDIQLAALRELFPAWFIGPAPFSGWRAEWRSESGLSIRYVGGNTIADLHKRLEVIEAARGESE